MGFRSSVASIAAFRSAAFSRLLQQFWQLQLKQYSPDAKHSQYLRRHGARSEMGAGAKGWAGGGGAHSLRQREFLQLHCRLGCGFAGLFVGLAIILKRWFRRAARERMLAADFAQREEPQPARGRRGIHVGFWRWDSSCSHTLHVAEKRARAACSSAGL